MKFHSQMDLVWEERAPAELDHDALDRLETDLHFRLFHVDRPHEVVIGRRSVFETDSEYSFLRLIRLTRAHQVAIQLIASPHARHRERFAAHRLAAKEFLAQISDSQDPFWVPELMVGVKDLIATNAHMGQRTQRWNPKMRRFIATSRGGFHVIDLLTTIDCLNEAHAFLSGLLSSGGNVLFVGTRDAASDLVAARAGELGMPFVTSKWLGGMLTNWQTTRQRLNRLNYLTDIDIDTVTETKKEAVLLRRDRDRLVRRFGGLSGMIGLPDALFVVDPVREHLAVAEARILRIPVIGIVDTDADPDLVDYKIPANPGSEACIDLIMRVLTSGSLPSRQD